MSLLLILLVCSMLRFDGRYILGGSARKNGFYV